MKMQYIYAASYDDLLISLKKINITVPERSEGRTSTDCERWSICRFLATFGSADLLMYPLLLKHRDRPDFLISYNSICIGIEATEAIYQSYANAQYIWSKSYSQNIIDPSHFKNQKTLPKSEIQRIVSSNRLCGHGWEGDEPESEWANYLFEHIKEKNFRANKGGFEIFLKNWLLIYDNMHTPGIHIGKCCSKLLDKIANSSLIFDHILIEHSNVIIKINIQSREYSIHNVVNLWL